MITNGKVLKWSEPVEKAYANAVDRIIVNVARHLRSGKAIHTAKWETQKLSEMGQLTAENARIIRDALRQMPKDMKDALDDTAKESLRLVDEAIEEAIRTGAIERSPISSTQGVIDELSQQALDQMNLVNTVMLESSQKAYLKCVNDTVRWENSMLSEQQTQAALETLNDATTAVLSGGETRTLALRRAIKELNAAGLYGFVDKRGRHWSPEAYVNMCMRTTVHNVAVRSVQARQQDYGSSIFQCSYHPASRPEHYPFQNKFYSWDGTSGTFTDGMGGKHQYESVTVTGYGTAAGLFGINCGHFPLPQIPGVTVPSDPDMQSAETDARQYKESQEQRQLERNIRMSKRLEEAYKAAGDDAGAAEAGMRTKLEQARMREFIDRTGRVRRYDREQISGYGPDKLVRPKPKRTAPKKVTPPAPTGQMKVENYPDAFTKTPAEKKNTKALVDFVNGIAGKADQTVLKLYRSVGKMFDLEQNQFPFKVGHSKDHAFNYRYSGLNGKLTRAQIDIPKLTGPDIIGKINTTLHEQMHMIDMYLRTERDSHFHASAFGSPVISRFDKVVNDQLGKWSIGPKTQKLFDDFHKAYDKLSKEQTDRAKEVTEEVTRRFYPDGHVDVFADFSKWKQFKREREKAVNAVYDEYGLKKRAAMGGGIDGLQDIYDALSGGQFRDMGTVKYGHGSRYFGSVDNRKAEIVANYGALSITRPDLIKVLKEEQPELVDVLEDFMKELAAKVV